MPRVTIRAKLLFLSIALLSIPYIGLEYLRETERYLQSSLEESLLAVAGALAVSLQSQSESFQNPTETNRSTHPLFVHTLRFPIHIDGYTDDWAQHLEWRDRFNPQEQAALLGRNDLSFNLVVGAYEQYVNLLIQVDDESFVYQSGGLFEPSDADTVELIMYGEDDKLQSVFFGTASPGPVTAYTIVENWDYSNSRYPINNIIGEWRETDYGYVVEIRIPRFRVRDNLAIVVHDKDTNFTESLKASTSDFSKEIVPNVLLHTSMQLQHMIERIELKNGRRVWMTNRNGQVLASGGSLEGEYKPGISNLLYTWILPAASDSFEDDLRSASRLRGEEVLEALEGRKSTRWRSTPDDRAVIVSAAHPVLAGNELIGTVVVEETTNSIQTLQRDAMAVLFNRSVAIFLGVSLMLLVFATYLSYRITKLKNQAERAVDQHGRVVGKISQSAASDEIGDLSRSYSTMVDRLADYNTYLESMASKLSHEFRTPLTVVSSSLQNLDALEAGSSREPYLSRALEGTNRLHNLVSRLSEAARLEQSVANVEFEEFDLSALLEGCVDGYRNIYPSPEIRLNQPSSPCLLLGSGDLIAQMMDKLIDNAIAFSPDSEPIQVSMECNSNRVELRVVNRGSSLPKTMQSQIFNSMVSLREANIGKEPHLGLGLYISRLIVELHGGTIEARNLADNSGVEFMVVLPGSEKPPAAS